MRLLGRDSEELDSLCWIERSITANEPSTIRVDVLGVVKIEPGNILADLEQNIHEMLLDEVTV